LAAITRRHAALFVDGRYTVQARAECDTALFDLPGFARGKLVDWLKEKVRRGDAVGFDPWLHTVAEIARLRQALEPSGIKLKPTRANLVDRIWGRERPAPPASPVVPHALKYAGRSAEAKMADIQKKLKEAGHDAAVLTLPESISWAFNIRGADVAHNPVVLSFAIIPAHGKPEIFITPQKLGREARSHLEPVAKLSEPKAMTARLAALRKGNKRVLLDPDRAAWWFGRALGLKGFVRGPDPCLDLKAVKNAVEIRGARTAHVRDGASLVRFLAWLDREAPGGGVDEIAAVRQLEAFRAGTQALKEISFDTISGSGPHGAIVHYRVSERTNRALRTGELFLVDSGAQYLDGTTDVTRTVAIGAPSEEMRERFTLVLKGHIAIATLRFPKGTRGIDLDPFARRALWERGLDYDHGTGHGVGSYLSVHEGPQSISRAGMAALEPGMICSNEPGYYKEGAYGIRIESLVLVTGPEKPAGGDIDTMGFETLTLVPIDRRLIATDLLSGAERRWVDDYHARVRALVAPEVEAEARAWLEAATEPL
jgi:Xaa-Pro aminopeptidase